MVDINKINSIKDAQDAEYNGKKLTADEKKVFDNSALKPGGTLDTAKLKEACTLLDNVKKAEASTSKNATILTALEAAKTGNTDAFKAINSHNTQVDTAITRLKGFGDDGDRRGGKTEEEWKTEKANFDAKAIEAQKTIDAKNKEIESWKKTNAERSYQHQLAKQHRQNVEKLEKYFRLEDPTGKQFLNHIIDRNTAYATGFVTYTGSNNHLVLQETDLAYSANRVLGSWERYHIALSVWEHFSQLDEAALTPLLTADAKSAWDNLQKMRFIRYEKDKVFDGYTCDRENTEKTTRKEDFDAIQDEIRNIDSSTREIKGDKEWKTDKWPFVNADFMFEMGRFMKNALPKGSLNSSNAILSTSDTTLRNVLDKTVDISFKALPAMPAANDVKAVFIANPAWKVEKITSKVGDEKGLTKLFWDTFNNPGELDEYTSASANSMIDYYTWNSAAGAIDKSKKRKRTKFEVERFFMNNLLVDAQLEMVSYANYIEWALKNAWYNKQTDKVLISATDPSTHTPALTGYQKMDVEFNNDWRSAAMSVGKSAYNTFNPKCSQHANASKEMKERLKDPSYIGNKPYTHIETSFNAYTRLRTNAIMDERVKKVAVDSDTAYLSQLNDERRKAEAEKREAEAQAASAQEFIDKFLKYTLPQLKEEFKKVYGQGSTTTKYDNIELGKLLLLLEMIKDKEPNKKLDSEFSGYEENLTFLNNQLQPYYTLLNPWLATGGTVKKKLITKKIVGWEAQKKQLELIQSALRGINETRGKLGIEEKEELDSINTLLSEGKEVPVNGDPNKGPDATDITLDILKTATGNADLTAAELTKWHNFASGVYKKNKAKLEKLFTKYKTNGSSERVAIVTHIKEKGTYDIDNSKNNDSDKLTKTGDDGWKEFTKKDPKVVVATIIAHENEKIKDSSKEAERGAIIERMKTAKAKKDTYGDPDKSADITKEQFIKFLYDEEVNELKTDTSDIPAPQQNGDDGKKKWWHWSRPSGKVLWIGVSLVALIGVAAVIFWDSLKTWWTGDKTNEEGSETEKEGESE